MTGYPREPITGPLEPEQGSCVNCLRVSQGDLAEIQPLLVKPQSEARPGVNSGALQAPRLLKHLKTVGKMEYLLTANACNWTFARCTLLYPADQLRCEEALQES